MLIIAMLMMITDILSNKYFRNIRINYKTTSYLCCGNTNTKCGNTHDQNNVLQPSAVFAVSKETNFTVKSGVPLPATLQYCHAILQY
jgi:hypothetical protein